MEDNFQKALQQEIQTALANKEITSDSAKTVQVDDIDVGLLDFNASFPISSIGTSKA